MAIVTIPQIVESLKRLPADKLHVVYDFVSFLEERSSGKGVKEQHTEAYNTMLASESVLGQDWEKPEEDLAWADL